MTGGSSGGRRFHFVCSCERAAARASLTCRASSAASAPLRESSRRSASSPSTACESARPVASTGFEKTAAIAHLVQVLLPPARPVVPFAGHGAALQAARGRLDRPRRKLGVQAIHLLDAGERRLGRSGRRRTSVEIGRDRAHQLEEKEGGKDAKDDVGPHPVGQERWVARGHARLVAESTGPRTGTRREGRPGIVRRSRPRRCR